MSGSSSTMRTSRRSVGVTSPSYTGKARESRRSRGRRRILHFCRPQSVSVVSLARVYAHALSTAESSRSYVKGLAITSNTPSSPAGSAPATHFEQGVRAVFGDVDRVPFRTQHVLQRLPDGEVVVHDEHPAVKPAHAISPRSLRTPRPQLKIGMWGVRYSSLPFTAWKTVSRFAPCSSPYLKDQAPMLRTRVVSCRDCMIGLCVPSSSRA